METSERASLTSDDEYSKSLFDICPYLEQSLSLSDRCPEGTE
jgi:hypothetical protein